MSTVFQALALDPKASLMTLGPVRVAARFPAKQTASGKWMRNIQVSDSSVEAKMTLWGPAAQLAIEDGSTVVFKGTIKSNLYNGATTITAERVTVDGANGLPADAPAGHGAPAFQPLAARAAAPVETKISSFELARQMAQFTAELQNQLLENGLSKEVTERMILRAPEFAALWWFGAKQLSMSEPAEEEVAPF